MSEFEQITSPPQAQAEVIVNESLEALQHVAVYGYKAATSSGLTWGYYGGRWQGFDITAATLTMTDSATNYIVVARATGVASVSTSSTNHSDTTNYALVYTVVVAGGVPTTITDERLDEFGVLAGGSGGGGGGGGGSTQGKQAIGLVAGSMRPSITAGCAGLTAASSGSNQPDIITLDFDAGSIEYAQFAIPMPKKWNEGTITARFRWSHAATTTNFGVVWAIQAVAVGDDDTIAVNFGTAQSVTDTGGTTNDLYITAETSAITVDGTPAAGDTVFFRVYRDATNGSDNLAIDARLHGVDVFVTTDADTDA